jgi:predicted transcriptional regulator
MGIQMDIGRPGQQQTYFRKVILKDNDQISLDADMIRLLIAIDENKSLYQIADEVDMRADTLKLNLEKLLKQGLIEPVKKELPVLDRIFLQALKINLSKVIGPMSEILIEEVVSEMELTGPEIPVDQAAELIAALSHEIPDEEKRIEFKKSMMDILNKKRT